MITFEVDAPKVALARHSFRAAGVDSVVELREGDGGAGLTQVAGPADLVFIDSEKSDYLRLLEPAISALRIGGCSSRTVSSPMSRSSWSSAPAHSPTRVSAGS